MPTFARLLLVFASLLLGPLVVLADDLPADTNKIESLTVEQARRLAETFKGVTVEVEIRGYRKRQLPNCLPLNGLKNLDADVAHALAGYSQGPLFLDGLTTLDADAAKALADLDVTALILSGLTMLDVASAKALAGFENDLSLNGLTTLESDTAKALAEFKGGLYLDGLTTLDAGTAKALAEFKGQRLQLRGLTTLDADTAKALAAVQKWEGTLPRVTVIDSPDSIAIAQAVATRKGPLSLPNLKKISPKTLAALIANEDIHIPLIETLELIPEPDGSVTEDFVIPKWLEERQKQQRAGQ